MCICWLLYITSVCAETYELVKVKPHLHPMHLTTCRTHMVYILYHNYDTPNKLAHVQNPFYNTYPKPVVIFYMVRVVWHYLLGTSHTQPCFETGMNKCLHFFGMPHI